MKKMNKVDDYSESVSESEEKIPHPTLKKLKTVSQPHSSKPLIFLENSFVQFQKEVKNAIIENDFIIRTEKYLKELNIAKLFQENNINFKRKLKKDFDFDAFKLQFFVLYFMRVLGLKRYFKILETNKMETFCLKIFKYNYQFLFQNLEKLNKNDPLFHILTNSCLVLFNKPEAWAYDLLKDNDNFNDMNSFELDPDLKIIIKDIAYTTNHIYNDVNNCYNWGTEGQNKDDESDASITEEMKISKTMEKTKEEIDFLLENRVFNNLYFFDNFEQVKNVYAITTYDGYIFMNSLYAKYNSSKKLKAHLIITILHEINHCKRMNFMCEGNILKKSPPKIEVGWFYEFSLFGNIVNMEFLEKNDCASDFLLNPKNYLNPKILFELCGIPDENIMKSGMGKVEKQETSEQNISVTERKMKEFIELYKKIKNC